MAAEDVNGGAGEQAATMSEMNKSALLVVIGEPFSGDHKDLLLKRVTKGLQCWDVAATGVDINEELKNLANAAPTGSEGPNGEKVITHETDALRTDIVVQPQLATCTKALRSFLLSPAKHRFLLYAGHAFKESGDWILQDDCFNYEKFASVCKESDVENALKQSEGGGSLSLYTFPEGHWNNGTINKLNISKILDVKLNPAEKLDDSNGILQFTAYLSYFLKPQPPKNLLQASDVVGNIRFSRPTLYIFPGCQGDASLFGVSGFNLLINAGFSRKACFWDFARHLDRIDAFVLTHLSPNNIFGASTFLERKAQDNVHPEIGYVYMNASEKVGNIPNGESDGSNQSLLVSLIEEGKKMVANLKSIGQSPHPCVGHLQGQNLQPLTLYHKVGHGTLEMFVLNPLQDSKEMKDFLSQWSKQVDSFSSTKCKVGGKEVGIPLPNAVSVSALLVWTPSNPAESFTRILLPGNSPQSKLFEGLDKLKSMGMFQHATCCQDDLNSPSKPAGKAKPPAGKAAASRPATTKAAPAPAKTERKPVERKPLAKTTPAKTSKDERNKKAAAGKVDKKSPTVSSPSSSAPRTPPPSHSTPEPSPAGGDAKIEPPLLTPELEKEVAIKEVAALIKEEAVKAEPLIPAVSPALEKPPAPMDDSLLKDDLPATDTSAGDQSSFAFEADMSHQYDLAADLSAIGSPEPLPDPGQVGAKALEQAEPPSPAKEVPEVNGDAFANEEGPNSPPPSPVDQLVNIEKAEVVESAPEMASPIEPVTEQEEAKSPIDFDQADTAPISSPESEPSQVDALPSEPAATAFVGSAGQQDLFDLGIYDDEVPSGKDDIPHPDLARSQHEEVLKASQMTSSIYEPSDPAEAGAADVSAPEALQAPPTAVTSEQHNAPEVDQVFGGASPEGLPEPVTPEMDMSPQGNVEVADANEALMMTKNPFMCNEEQPVSEEPLSEPPAPEQPTFEQSAPSEATDTAEPNEQLISTELEAPVHASPEESEVAPPSPEKSDAEVAPPSPEKSDAEVDFPSPVKSDAEVDPPSPVKLGAEVDPPSPVKSDAEVDPPSPEKSDAEVASPSPEKSDAEVDSPSPVKLGAEIDPPSPVKLDAEVDPPSPEKSDAEVAPPSPEKSDAEVASPSPEKLDAEVAPPSPEKSDAEVASPSPEKLDVEVAPLSPVKLDAEVDPPSPVKLDAEVASPSPENSDAEVAPSSPEKSDAAPVECAVPESPEQARSPEATESVAPMSPEMPEKDTAADDSLEQPKENAEVQPEEPKKQRSLSPEEQRDSSQEPPDSLTGSYSEEQVYRTSRPDEVASLVEEEGYDDFYGMEAARFMQNQDQAVPQNQNPFNLVDSPMECGLAEPDQSINPFLGVPGGEAPQPDDNLFGIPAATEGNVPDQLDPFSPQALQEKLPYDDKEEDVSRDSLERDFDPLKSWGQPMGLPTPPPPSPVANAENKKPATKRTTGLASKKPSDAKKAAAPGRTSLGGRTTLKKDPKKDEPEKKDAAENKRPTSATKTATSRTIGSAKKPAAKPAAGDKLNGSMSKEAPKKTAATKARPATAPTTKARPGAAASAAATKRPVTASSRADTPTKAAPLTPVVPFYVELAYVPCHGDPHYSDLDFFRRVRARYYVVSALNPSSTVFNALLEAKQTWEKSDCEVTIIPTYDTETLRQWMGLHREELSQLKIHVAASANRCTIQLQDHETSCSAYRLEF